MRRSVFHKSPAKSNFQNLIKAEVASVKAQKTQVKARMRNMNGVVCRGGKVKTLNTRAGL